MHSEGFSQYSKTWENNKINIYKTEKASDFNYLYFVLYSLNLYGKESILNVSIHLRYFIKELFLKYLKSFIFFQFILNQYSKKSQYSQLKCSDNYCNAKAATQFKICLKNVSKYVLYGSLKVKASEWIY